jgi:hypothetical protein
MHTIFSNSFIFTIPDYQRQYSWTTEHTENLLDDLLDAMGDDGVPVDGLNPYFLGSIVLIKELTAPKSEVVDGQQRLTTLTILISALRSLASPGLRPFLSKVLYQEGDPLIGTEDRFRLSLRERDAEFFRENVQREGGFERLESMTDSLRDAKRRIRENALCLKQRLESLDEQRRDDLAKFILTRCFLVVVATPDFDSAFRIFSVLNTRGLDLSHADILKAQIIGSVPDQFRSDYAKKWEDIEEELTQGSFQSLFGHIRMIFRKAKAQGTLLEEFRTHVRPTEDPRRFIDDTLGPYARAYGEITGADFEGTTRAEQINEVAENLGLIDNTDWIAPAIYFLQKYRNDPEVLLRHLRDLERLAAGTMVIRTNFNHRMERYGRLLRAAEKGEDLFQEGSPLQLTVEECQKAIQVLDGDVYNSRISRPVLLRLDGLLSDEGAVYHHKVITVEHVLPQNPRQDSAWLSLFPDEEERLRDTHRLGNLVLLSRRKNSRAQNFDFERKKHEYFQRGGVAPFALTAEVLTRSEWTPEVVDERQRDLLGRLKSVWRL